MGRELCCWAGWRAIAVALQALNICGLTCYYFEYIFQPFLTVIKEWRGAALLARQTYCQVLRVCSKVAKWFLSEKV